MWGVPHGVVPLAPVRLNQALHDAALVPGRLGERFRIQAERTPLTKAAF